MKTQEPMINLSNTDVTENLIRSRIDRQKIYGKGDCFVCKKNGATVICGRPGSYEAGTAHESCLKEYGK